MAEKIFVLSLMSGFLFTFLFFLTTGNFRILRSKRLRPFRRMSRAKDGSLTPWGTPIFLGMFLTLFGFSGLVIRILLRVPVFNSLALASLAGLVLAGTGIWLLRRYFAVKAYEVKGNPLPGMIGHVSLAIPAGGVGVIACKSEGRRVTIPARDRGGDAVAKGSRVLLWTFSTVLL
jgi:hypothetical protein